ncbi:hypothetical protein L218DRAFT_852763 [Marasmius fiardii PR-910]|nr:hypothetical protein L218DRAFT_852763 [Marasmius fiardii PR-910]
MGLLAYFYTSTSGPTPTAEARVQPHNEPDVEAASAEMAKDSLPDPPNQQPTLADVTIHQSPNTESSTQLEEPLKPRARRFSLTALTKPSSSHKEHTNAHKAILTGVKEHKKESNAAAALSKRVAFSRRSKSEKRAKESALIVRSIIVGPSASSPTVTPVVAKPRMNKLKSDLSKPKTANKVIAQLRSLPVSDPKDDLSKGHTTSAKPCAPIHAVCLEHPDKQEEELHFAQISPGGDIAEHDKLSALISELNVVDLFKTTDFGLGQPGNGEGLLAGAIPTAETVISGVERITPELMALGYATGRSILPDHKGVYPPTDRMSVITYWWGLEIILPPSSIAYLSTVKSISNTAVNFLSAISLVNNGVREILPFVRYIAQFMEYEFNAIKAQDKGDGVVCAATWIMPAALVPRPWDFPAPPAAPTIFPPITEETERNNEVGVQPDNSTTTAPPALPSDHSPASPNASTTPPTVTNPGPPAKVPASTPDTQPENLSMDQPPLPNLPNMTPVA